MIMLENRDAHFKLEVFIGMIISWILIVILGKHGLDLSVISKGMEAFGLDASNLSILLVFRILL